MAEILSPVTWTRNIDVETESPIEGVVTGKIPEWLEGTLIRNGSGLYKIGETKMNHLFDGLSVLHRFVLRHGKSTYQNKILKSNTYLESKAANRLTMHQFGTFAHPDPCKSLFGKLMSRFEPVTNKAEKTDNCSVNVCYLGDKLYALTETPHLREISRETLDVIGEKLNISDFVAVNHSTAHPHVDEDGTVYNMGNSIGPKGPCYNVIEFPPGDEALTGAKIVATFETRWKISHSYYHSFGITDNYFVFVEYPLVLNTAKLLAMNLRQKALDWSLDWLPKEKARIILVKRNTGVAAEIAYEAPPFFCFHHGNAYEKDGYLVMDLSHCENATVFNGLSLKELCKNQGDFIHTYYTRFVLPLAPLIPTDKGFQTKDNLISIKGSKCTAYWTDEKTIFCQPDRLLDQSLELPRINYFHNGRAYRFVYGISMRKGYAESEKVLKLDVESRELKEWVRVGFTPSEPIYVTRPGSVDEDDGVIIFSALDQKNAKKVLLVVLNASSFVEEACVEFITTGIVTKDFHGIFSRDGDSVNRY